MNKANQIGKWVYEEIKTIENKKREYRTYNLK